MPCEYYTLPRWAEERVDELKIAGFKVKKIRLSDEKKEGLGPDKLALWVVCWSGKARFIQTKF